MFSFPTLRGEMYNICITEEKNAECRFWSILNDVKSTQINAVDGYLLASSFTAKEFHTIDFHFQNHINFYWEHLWKQAQPLPVSSRWWFEALCARAMQVTSAQQNVTAVVSPSGDTATSAAKDCTVSSCGMQEKTAQNFSWSLESHHLEKRDRSWAKLPSMTTCLEQEASLWLENWLIAWYLLRTRGGFGSQYIWTRQYFPSQPETWCFKMLFNVSKTILPGVLPISFQDGSEQQIK